MSERAALPREAAPTTPAIPAPVEAPTRGTAGRTRLTALIVACALFMQNLDSTVVATALPAMARAFGAEPLHMNVALTSYLLSLAVFIPASGWVADRFGTRTVFRAAIAVFTLGSVLCGRAESLPFLVGARVIQGMGGALMVPVGRLVLLRSVAKSELVAAMAWLTVPAMVGPVVGPPLGGFITTYVDWSWIFYINVPIGVLGIVLVSRYVEDVREPPAGPFDILGLLLSGTALTALLLGFETIGRGLVPWTVTALALALGAAAAAGYVLHARRSKAPLLDLGLLRFPTFALAVYGGTLFRIGIGAIPFLLPLMLQLGFGRSAAESGLITFASSAGAMVMKPVAQRVLRAFGFRATLAWNGVLSAALLSLCAWFRPDWPVVAIYAVLLTGGFFRSLQFTSYNAIAYAEVPRSRMSGATSLYATVQQLSQTIGITLGAATLGLATWWSGHAEPSLHEYSLGFVVVSLVTLAAAPMARSIPADAGSEMSGHRAKRE